MTAALRGIFVTGTDTGVGKTLIAAALAAWYRQQGCDVGVMKPIATGGRWIRHRASRRLVSDDAIMLANAAGVDDPWSLITPVCFREPLAPWTAAMRAHRSIDLHHLVRRFCALADRHPFTIVEGIGGLLVPLTSRLTVADLAKRLGLPLVIVARRPLGTINHTLLTLAAARAHGLRVVGVVFNDAQRLPPDPLSRLAARTNPAMIERFAKVPVLGTIPFQPSPAPVTWVDRYLDWQRLPAWCLDHH